MRLRSLLALVLLLALVAIPVGAEDAEPEPELALDEVTFFLHGGETVGELDIDLGTYRKMDRTEPTGDMPKSLQVVNYAAGPNTRCDGNFLLPTWEGIVRGNVKGDMTVTIPALAPPGAEITVELHANAGIGCVTEDPVPVPTARETVTLGAGLTELEVTFTDLDFENRGLMNIMIHGNAGPRNQARLLYDAADYAASVTFDCFYEPGPRRTGC